MYHEESNGMNLVITGLTHERAPGTKDAPQVR